MTEDPTLLAPFIEHTLLDPTAKKGDLIRLCDEAVAHGFYGVCVYPQHVGFCAERLEGSGVQVVSVAGFPTGDVSTDHKVADARRAVTAGATEVDMVIARSALAACDYAHVLADMAGVRAALSGTTPAVLKVIVESAELDDAGIGAACALAVARGADFVKTSTGFGPGGASEHAVATMARIVGAQVGIKASGGIKITTQARTLQRAAGGHPFRIGASASLALIGHTQAGQK